LYFHNIRGGDVSGKVEAVGRIGGDVGALKLFQKRSLKRTDMIGARK